MKEKNYKTLKTELDEALAWFDGDNLDVDDAIAQYEKALKLTKELEAYLKKAENTIKKVET
jgi:exodeoxyribonuclease VII small subunit